MKKKPKVLNYFSFSFLLISALSVFEIVLSWKTHLQNTIPFHNLAFFVLGLWGACCAWQASSLLYVVFLALWSFVAIGTLSIFQEGVYIHHFLVFLASSVIIFLQTLWFLGSFQKLVLQPRTHWWKTPLRVTAGFKAIVRTYTGSSFLAEVSNLSKNGMLVGLGSADETSSSIDVGAPIKIHFVLNRYDSIKCVAEIVRQQPPYYGMKITDIDARSRRSLEKFIEEKNRVKQLA